MHSPPPLARAPPSFLPHSPFPFHRNNSINHMFLSFIPQKSINFIISATHPSPQTPKSDFPFITPHGFPPKPISLPSPQPQNQETRNKNPQDLTPRFEHGNSEIETIAQFNDQLMALVLADEPDLAYKLYSTLPAFDFSADSLTFSLLIHCCCKRNEPMEGKMVLEQMIGNGFNPPKVKTFTQLINSFCKKGRLHQAFEVFGIMGEVKCHPTINTYNCLLKGLCYVGRVEEAHELFTKIKKSWKVPKIVGARIEPITSHVHHLSKFEYKRPVGLEPMKRGLEPTTSGSNVQNVSKFEPKRPIRLELTTTGSHTQNVSKFELKRPVRLEPKTLQRESGLEPMTSYTHNGSKFEPKRPVGLEPVTLQRERGLEPVVLHAEGGLEPDIYTYTALMDGFCKVGRSNEALELLGEAIEMGLNPSVVTYNTILNGYFKEGRPMEGLGLLRQMRERNCSPDCISYSTLLHGLLQWGEIRAGVGVYHEMLEMGFEVEERMMNTLLRALCRRSRKERGLLKDAHQVFDEMSRRGCVVDPCAHELMIEVFCNGNEMDKAFVSLCGLIGSGWAPRAFTLNVVLGGLCVEGKIEKALSVLVSVLRGRIGMLDRVVFDAFIDEMNRQGKIIDAACVYCVALKNGVIPRKKPMQ